jgi:hypothetical protein
MTPNSHPTVRLVLGAKYLVKGKRKTEYEVGWFNDEPD